jgi:hypothetical protein
MKVPESLDVTGGTKQGHIQAYAIPRRASAAFG